MKDFIRRLKNKKIRSLALRRCLCVTLLIKKEGKEHGKKLHGF
jgi:hypothetical protein